MDLLGLHHIAIICSNYQRSKQFYTEVLGLTIVAEHYRAQRQSFKLDLAIGNQYQIELFSFPNPPKRSTQPEACGLRHLAFSVTNLEAFKNKLVAQDIVCEPIRVDEFTNKQFFFCYDPDQLPIEIYSR